ncbi:MAG: class I SAM-dependent methyltransferase [Planctomycetota bacterium]
MNLRETFGPIDVYLFDQILRGRIERDHTILDIGCGSGRNLVYFLREGYDVAAADPDEGSVHAVRDLFRALAPSLATETSVRHEPAENLSFETNTVDVVLCNAVLHFAKDAEHFDAMLEGMWRVLKPGGLFFARLASSIGMESRMKPIGNGWYALPDGSTRFLVDQDRLVSLTQSLGAELVDPIKTTVVQDARCMTTWVIRKN